ncbi:MAG: hypothetical protein ACOYT4_03810 [Nanoarchaeota archaeon]
MDKNLLIFDMEGTLGDYIDNKSMHPPFLKLRPVNLIDGLKELRDSNKYHIVCASHAIKKAIKPQLEYMKSNGFEFEEVFSAEDTRINNPFDSEEMSYIYHLKNLSKIYLRLGLNSKEIQEKVLVIEDLQLHKDKIYIGDGRFGERNEEYLIFEPIALGEFHTMGTPFPEKGQTPTVLLVPNHRLFQETVSMRDLVEIINEIYNRGDKNFLEGFNRINDPRFIKCTTNMMKCPECQFEYATQEYPDTKKFKEEITGDFVHNYLIINPNKMKMLYEPEIIKLE